MKILDNKKSLCTFLAASLFALAPATALHAQSAVDSYPPGPVTLVVPFSSGGGVDIVGRILGEALTKELGKPIVVENKPGASGMIGAGAVAASKPDGMTLLLASSGESAINPHLYKDMSYDPAKDLAPVTLVAKIPNLITVPSSMLVSNLAEFIAYTKKNSKKMSYSSSGVGNIQNISGELLNKLLGTSVLHIPYKGSAQALADVAGGQVSLTFSSAAAALPYIQSGKIKPIGVTSEQPMKAFPNVPPLNTAPELKEFTLVNWFGLFVRAGTPEGIVQKLNKAVVKALKDPKVVKALETQGAEPSPMTPAEFTAFRNAQSDLFAQIIKDAGIKIN